MSFDAIRENKILTKISGFTVVKIDRLDNIKVGVFRFLLSLYS